jgi:hypothetical protein
MKNPPATAEYCVYLMPYRDGPGISYQPGYCKHGEIANREQRHRDRDDRDYIGELRVIEMERRSPRKGDWGMLVSGEYNLKLLTRDESISALRFVKRQHAIDKKMAYEASPARAVGTPS